MDNFKIKGDNLHVGISRDLLVILLDSRVLQWLNDHQICYKHSIESDARTKDLGCKERKMNIPIDNSNDDLPYPCTPSRIRIDTFDMSCDCSLRSFQSPIDILDNPWYEQKSSWLFLNHPCISVTTFSRENRRMANKKRTS